MTQPTAFDPYAAARVAKEIDLVKAANPGCYTFAGVPYVAVKTAAGIVLQKAGRKVAPGQMSLFGAPASAPKATGKNVGRTKTVDGITYKLNRNSRWERTDKGQTAAAKPALAVLRDEPATDTPTPYHSAMPETKPEAGAEVVDSSATEGDDDFDFEADRQKGQAQILEAQQNSNYGRLYLDIKSAINKKDDSPQNRTAAYSKKRNYREALYIIDQRFKNRDPLIDQRDKSNTVFAGLNIQRFMSRSLKTPDDYTAKLRDVQSGKSSMTKSVSFGGARYIFNGGTLRRAKTAD